MTVEEWVEYAVKSAAVIKTSIMEQEPDEKEKGRRHRIEENGVSYYGKVHNCLLDSWQQLREDPSTSGKVIYDVCSVYGYGAF